MQVTFYSKKHSCIVCMVVNHEKYQSQLERNHLQVYSCKINEVWQQTFRWHSSVDIWYKKPCENMQPALNKVKVREFGVNVLSTSLLLIKCSVRVLHKSLPLQTLSNLKWPLPWRLWRPPLNRGPRRLPLHKANRWSLLIGSVSKRWSCSGQCRSQWEQ